MQDLIMFRFFGLFAEALCFEGCQVIIAGGISHVSTSALLLCFVLSSIYVLVDFPDKVLTLYFDKFVIEAVVCLP